MMALVVESDKETLENVDLTFQICLPDCRLETASSGKECLEMVKAKCPDIVILDRDLPDEDGFNVLRQIRTHSQVPVIFLSNVRDEYETVKAIEMGADECITKPIRQLEFIVRVRALLRRNKVINNMNTPTKRRQKNE
jgi:DNA-binding response OmpR family regulator